MARTRIETRKISDGKKWTVLTGDVKEVCKALEADSFAACLCDAPYGLAAGKTCTWDDIEDGKVAARGGFMGEAWDSAVPGARTWAEVLRVLLPGAPLVSFFGTRTYHRGACALEDAGFDACDMFSWLHGQGWPKGLDMSKAMDKAAGAKRKVVGHRQGIAGSGFGNVAHGLTSSPNAVEVTEPASAGGLRWQGYNTQIKPAQEIAAIVRKPFDARGMISRLAWLVKEAILGLPSYAKHAEESSSSRVRESVGDVDSARWLALLASDTPDASFEAMATWRSGSELPTSLNIAWSWLATLAELWDLESTSTTETKSSTTIDSRIWNFCPSKITPDTIVSLATKADGKTQNAWLVERFFEYASHALASIRTLSAIEIAISSAGERASFLREGNEPAAVMRKPFRGTFAQNAEANGVGGYNVDECRIGMREERLLRGGATSGRGVGYGGAVPQDAIDGGVGRYPSNVILGHLPECRFAGTRPSTDHGTVPVPGTTTGEKKPHAVYGDRNRIKEALVGRPDEGVWECPPECTVRRLDEQMGRYPTNVILGHSPECRRVGTVADPQRVPITKSTGEVSSENRAMSGPNYGRKVVGEVGRPDLATWECSPECPVRRLDAQAGEHPAAMTGRAAPDAKFDVSAMSKATPKAGEVLARQGGTGAVYADAGGVSRYYEQVGWEPGEFEELAATFERFLYQGKASKVERGTKNTHKTVKPMALALYLATLLRPPRGGKILVPFCGSGSEMLGAMLAGWDEVVGIELDPKMADVARWRIETATVRTSIKTI